MKLPKINNIKKYIIVDHAHKKMLSGIFPFMWKIKINMKYKKTEKSINLSHNGSKKK